MPRPEDTKRGQQPRGRKKPRSFGLGKNTKKVDWGPYETYEGGVGGHPRELAQYIVKQQSALIRKAGKDGSLPQSTTGGGASYSRGYGGGGGGGGGGARQPTAAELAKPYLEWAAENGYNIKSAMGKKLLKLAVANEWSIGHLSRLVRLRDTKTWLGSATGGQEARDIIKAYHEWFPNQKPGMATLRGLYKLTKGGSFDASTLDSYFRRLPEFKQQFKYISDPSISPDLAQDPTMYRKYLNAYNSVYRQYMGGDAPESDIAFFFKSTGGGLTPETFESNIRETTPYIENYQLFEGKPFTQEQQRTALYGGAGAMDWRTRLQKAASQRAQFLGADTGQWGARMEESGEVKLYGV